MLKQFTTTFLDIKSCLSIIQWITACATNDANNSIHIMSTNGIGVFLATSLKKQIVHTSTSAAQSAISIRVM